MNPWAETRGSDLVPTGVHSSKGVNELSRNVGAIFLCGLTKRTYILPYGGESSSLYGLKSRSFVPLAAFATQLGTDAVQL